jgi:restriction system protein
MGAPLAEWAYVNPKYPNGLPKSALSRSIDEIQYETALWWFRLNYKPYDLSGGRWFGFAEAGDAVGYGQGTFPPPQRTSSEILEKEFNGVVRPEVTRGVSENLPGAWMELGPGDDWPGTGDASIALSISGLILPNSVLLNHERKTAEGILIKSTYHLWREVLKLLGSNWSLAYEIPPDRWEEIIAGAFKNNGYDEVVLTPRSGDHGRDVIATTRGVGCVKIISSVKAYKPDNAVPYDAVRSLLGVMSGEQNVSKGIVATTSTFPSLIAEDPYIKPFLPTRLELMDGVKLKEWLSATSDRSKA